MKAAAFIPLLFVALGAFAAEPNAGYTGDVKDVRVVRGVEQHPGASLLWEPYIAEWKPKHLVVAFGAGIPGKVDMGDISPASRRTTGTRGASRRLSSTSTSDMAPCNFPMPMPSSISRHVRM